MLQHSNPMNPTSQLLRCLIIQSPNDAIHMHQSAQRSVVTLNQCVLISFTTYISIVDIITDCHFQLISVILTRYISRYHPIHVDFNRYNLISIKLLRILAPVIFKEMVHFSEKSLMRILHQSWTRVVCFKNLKKEDNGPKYVAEPQEMDRLEPHAGPDPTWPQGPVLTISGITCRLILHQLHLHHICNQFLFRSICSRKDFWNVVYWRIFQGRIFDQLFSRFSM